MATLDDFLRVLFAEGQVVLRDRPDAIGRGHPGASERLADAFDGHRLDVAGPPIRFAPASALAAAEWLHRACWYLVDRSEPAEAMERALRLAAAPATASDHLSADVVFRFLPQVRRRALAATPGDRLAAVVARVLRRWPLSGVLADVEDGPEHLGDLGGHPGLWLLYAERFVEHPRPAWLPPAGPIRDRVDWVGQGVKKGGGRGG